MQSTTMNNVKRIVGIELQSTWAVCCCWLHVTLAAHTFYWRYCSCSIIGRKHGWHFNNWAFRRGELGRIVRFNWNVGDAGIWRYSFCAWVDSTNRIAGNFVCLMNQSVPWSSICVFRIIVGNNWRSVRVIEFFSALLHSRNSLIHFTFRSPNQNEFTLGGAPAHIMTMA